MSLKVGALFESHCAMIRRHTTHLATLLSLVESREYVNHKERRKGGKRSSGLPGSRLLEASARVQTREPLCALKKINSRRHGRLFPPYLHSRVVAST
jgi:hypothetical protein